MSEKKEPEVMTAEELKRKVQQGEDVTVTDEDMTEAKDVSEAEEAAKEGQGEADGDRSSDDKGSDKPGESDKKDGSDADESGDDEKSGKNKRKKKKDKKDPRDEKIAELEEIRLRQLAEFENFRNRSEKEKEARFDMGARSVVEKILPVVDNLERGLAGLSDEEKESPFAKGIEAVYKQLMTSFSEMNVTPIEAVGKEFDPNLHQAVMHEEDDSDETNIITEELQKGYIYKDTVVRYSMVKVKN